MLHQTITPDICRTVLNERSLAMTLVAEVRRSLERDPVLARHYLERLEALLHPEAGAAGRKRDLLPASVLPASVFSDGIADRPSKRKGGLAPWQERRVVDYIDANLATPILAEHLAALVGLSAGHFTRAFKASTGETPTSSSSASGCAGRRSSCWRPPIPSPVSPAPAG